MKAKIWLVGWAIIVISALVTMCYWVYRIDPYFHYHKPDLEKYYYTLDNQRYQNDGICQHFDYDAIITGTSLTENFRTSEMDSIFGCHSIKVPYAGATYKEINDNLKRSLNANNDIKTIVRCLDTQKFFDTWDYMRTELGVFPTYMYDNNPFNDIKYLLSRNIVFKRAYQMSLDTKKPGFKGGITSFDNYSRWQNTASFGINVARPDGISVSDPAQSHLSDSDKEIIKKNILVNVTDLADAYPNVDFYYYYSPYSVVVWNEWKNEGSLLKRLEAEAYVTELILPHKNIHLFSFNNRTDITSDLNNYTDGWHYASWVNSLILKWMYSDKYRLTESNYHDYLKQEYDFYTTYDYLSINSQVDYEADSYAGALLNNELTGAEPFVFDTPQFSVDLDKGYNYLSFYAQKVSDNTPLSVHVYDKEGMVIGKVEVNQNELDNDVHHYVIDLTSANGIVNVEFEEINNSDADFSNEDFLFSKIIMY